MKNLFILLVLFVVFGIISTFSFLYLNTHSAHAYEPQMLEPRGVAAMSAFDRLPYLKTQTSEYLASSYDRTGANNDGSPYSYYRNPQTNGYVVMEAYKPGCIYRTWATTSTHNFNQNGNIKIYFNGETTPRIDVNANQFFSGTYAPFLSPIAGNDTLASGGFYNYYPFCFTQSARVEFTFPPDYYQINYHLYPTAEGVTTYTGTENMSGVYSAWNNPYSDPKSESDNQTLSLASFNLAPGQSRILGNITGNGSIRSVALRIPQLMTTQYPSNAGTPHVTDNGRAHRGMSSFTLAIDPNNNGVILQRRLDYGIADQVADVFIDGELAGRWTNTGSDNTYRWQNSSFSINPVLTHNKSTIHVEVHYVSSSNNWNEFFYWAKNSINGNIITTDGIDVGDTHSENAHNYTTTNETWSGERTYIYPTDMQLTNDDATYDILAHTRIKMYWDSEINPSVDVPIGFFFGMGASGEGLVKGLLMGTNPTTHSFYNYFPMPYRQSARIEIINNSSNSIVSTSGSIQYSSQEYQGLGTTAGYFNALFSEQNPTLNGHDFNIASIDSGKGHVVAWIQDIQSDNDGILEGDDRIFVDNTDMNSTLHGTGTEDTFTSAWYFLNGPFTLPLNGSSIKNDYAGLAHRSMYREYLADTIPFEKKLKVNEEHGAIDDYNGHYQSALFAYVIKSVESMSLTDTLTIGNVQSEISHQYTNTNLRWSGSQTLRFIGRDDNGAYSGTGKSHNGMSQFTMSILPNNNGVRLSRLFDFSNGNQMANVYVDNALVGTWFTGGSNSSYIGEYDSFEIPQSFTQNKSSITVRVQYLSSTQNATGWSEYKYFTYVHQYPNQSVPSISPQPSNIPTPTPNRSSVRITNPVDGQIVQQGKIYSISATVSGMTSQKVVFKVNNTVLICTSITNLGQQYSCDWKVPLSNNMRPGIAAQTYMIEVSAIDGLGKIISDKITVSAK